MTKVGNLVGFNLHLDYNFKGKTFRINNKSKY